MHEICAPSDTIMLKSDSYGQKYLSRQYHKINTFFDVVLEHACLVSCGIFKFYLCNWVLLIWLLHYLQAYFLQWVFSVCA